MPRPSLLVCLLLSSCAATPSGARSAATHYAAPPAATFEGPTAGKNLLEYLMGPSASEACPDNAQLTLTDIDEESAAKFAGQVAACKGRTITVEINSPGGSVTAAFDIQKAIERHNRPVNCVVDGMAASAAFVTLQSCTRRYMTDRSVLMAHEASMGVRGQSLEHTNIAGALRAVNWGMAERCSKRLGITHDQFVEHVSGGQEWYLSQADALREHAIDEAADSVAAIVTLAGEQ